MAFLNLCVKNWDQWMSSMCSSCWTGQFRHGVSRNWGFQGNKSSMVEIRTHGKPDRRHLSPSARADGVIRPNGSYQVLYFYWTSLGLVWAPIYSLFRLFQQARETETKEKREKVKKTSCRWQIQRTGPIWLATGYAKVIYASPEARRHKEKLL